MRANVVKDKKIWFRYLLHLEEAANFQDNTEEITAESGNWLSVIGGKKKLLGDRREWRDDSTELVQLRRVLFVRLDKTWEEMETWVFILFNWEGRQRVLPSENRKKCGTWWGHGSAGKSFTQKSDGYRPETDGLSQGRKKITSSPCLEGTQLSERKEKLCPKECIRNSQKGWTV